MQPRLAPIMALACSLGSTACGGGGGGGAATSSGDTSTQASTATSSAGGASSGSTTTTMATGGTSSGDEVSYASDVRPIFADRCTLCHHADMRVLNMVDPFAPEKGLVNAPNTWAVAHPEENPETMNVVPFEPENSFLMRKISDPNIDPVTSGAFMPWQIPRLTEQELSTLRQWILDGANQDEVYETQIRLIFGDGMSLATAGGKCAYCHRPGGMTPDLTNPFDPETGAVNVPGIGVFSDRLRIAPGDPDSSLLVQKVEATATTSELGAPMPMHYEPLTAEQIETVRLWILQGAQNN